MKSFHIRQQGVSTVLIVAIVAAITIGVLAISEYFFPAPISQAPKRDGLTPPPASGKISVKQPVDAPLPSPPELDAETADSKAVADLVKRFTAAYRAGDAKLARSILAA
jgi:hypothetical protein